MRLSLAAGLLLPLAALAQSTVSPQPGVTVLSDVRVIDGTGRAPLEHADVVLDGDHIRAVLTGSQRGKAIAGARVLNLAGKTVIPGLINGHGHLGQTKGNTTSPENFNAENIENQLVQYEFDGVTTVITLGQNKDLAYDLRDRSAKHELKGATLLTAGRGVGVEGGLPPPIPADQMYRPKTVDEARAAVREMASHHPEMLKMWVDDAGGRMPKMPPTMFQAVIEESHKAGVKISAHMFYLEDAKALIRAGLDVLAHSIRDKPVDAELIALMKQHGAWITPTLSAEDAPWSFAEKPAWINSSILQDSIQPDLRKLLVSPEFIAQNMNNPQLPALRKQLLLSQQNAAALVKAGVNVGFGTDSGSQPTRVQGFDEHRELFLMVQGGIAPLEAIRIATGQSAKMLGIDATTGTIAPGKQADLVVVAGNPAKNIGDTTRIAAVFHRGVEVLPLRTDARIPAAAW